jgi:cytochrome c553
MQKLIFFLFIIIILYGIYNARKKGHVDRVQSTPSCKICKSETSKRSILEKELSQIDTPEYIVRYIENIINHGSDTLGFKGGVMEGGYVAKEDAAKIACYVLELSGRKCPHAYAKDAAMFYTSVCGGCHGNDGKGLGGNYPDLTRKKLLGIERREAFLRTQIEKLTSDHRHSR